MAYARTGHAQWQYEYMGNKNIYTYDFNENQYAYCILYEYKNVYSPYYEDKEALVRVNRFREKKNIGTVGGNDTNYYLTVNNGGA